MKTCTKNDKQAVWFPSFFFNYFTTSLTAFYLSSALTYCTNQAAWSHAANHMTSFPEVLNIVMTHFLKASGSHQVTLPGLLSPSYDPSPKTQIGKSQEFVLLNRRSGAFVHFARLLFKRHDQFHALNYCSNSIKPCQQAYTEIKDSSTLSKKWNIIYILKSDCINKKFKCLHVR